jgi:hypothetical protein
MHVYVGDAGDDLKLMVVNTAALTRKSAGD